MGIIDIQGLVKRYNGTPAVNDVSMDVRQGEVFALLGPNGAGKTTTIKAMLGLLTPSAGRVTIDGYDVQRQGKMARRQVGYLPEKVAFYDNLSGRQTMAFYAELRGADVSQGEQLLDMVGLGGDMDKKVGAYSKGMVQRLGLAQALIGEPPVLVLDEPTGGLDPRGSWQIRQKIKTLNEQGTTVFLSSHILSEVQAVSDRVAILHHGDLMALDSLDALSERLDLQPVLRIRVREPTGDMVEQVRQVDGVSHVRLAGNMIEVRCETEAKPHIVNALEAAGGDIIDFTTEEPSLEEVFLRFTED
ncbi:MAG: ABC transporter ATP-binding protein [Candidatus Thermoplasmatota archaeon]|nr:ABC transporter ATP-binding protein [Candidatus Thermoplasmatota archaeon]